MKRSFSEFVNHSTHTFFEAVGNLFIFLPYFFSINTLLKTLFAPWKNVTVTKTEKGFSFSDLFDRMSYNAVSRGMGFVMRVSIILFYFILQIGYFLSLIIIVPIFFITLPLFYLITLAEPAEEVRKKEIKDEFVANHTMKPENRAHVESWFEGLYEQIQKRSQWWKLENLFAMPPIARDWAKGYTPTLDDYVEDLSDTSYQIHIKDIIGRKNELKSIEDALSKSEDANILLVGEEGVGKHAVIDAFAKRLYEGKTNNLLAYKRILKLNMEKVLTNFTDQQQREVFFETLLQEAASAGNTIMLIEGMDRYVTTGNGHVDLSIPIEKFGKTSVLQIIGTTSPSNYQKYIVPDEKIDRIFTKLDIYEVSRDQAIEILLNMTPSLEKRYKVVIPYETVVNTVDKSEFFITNLPFPEKSVQLLDTVCVHTVRALQKNIVTPEIVNSVLSEKAHVPVSLTSQLKDKLLHIEPLLLQHIVNQDTAIREVASAMRRAFLLLGKRKKPLASFLFLGPTGVGKTETAKALSTIFFSSDKNLLRFDMSLYQSRDDIGKLIGSSTTQDPGLLTEAIRNFPYGVLLLDELEKANHDLINIFLTILDEGYFTDGFGKRVDCKNLIIVATSNAGSEMTFSEHPNQAQLIQYLLQNHSYSPEFLNRFDGIVVYNNLDQNSALTIAKGMMKQVEEQIFSLYKVKVQVSDETLQSITKNNYDPQFGARDLERVLRQQIEDKVAKVILDETAKEGDTISL